MKREGRIFDGMEVMRLCERETKKVLRLRLSNNDRENCDDGSDAIM